MAITYPRSFASFASLLPIAETRFFLMRSEQMQLSGAGGAIVGEVADALWQAEIILDSNKWPDARTLEARINSLQGSLKSFMLSPTHHAFPAADPTGSVLGASVVTIYEIDTDNQSVKFSGLPSGYKITEGDCWSVAFGSNPTQTGFFQALEDATAAANTRTPFFQCTPHLWEGIEAGQTVKLIRPEIEAIIKPQTYEPGAYKAGRADTGRLVALQKMS